MEWISVKDSQPLENNAYLCLCKEMYLWQRMYHPSDAFFIGYFCDGKWSSREKYNCDMITHWTTLRFA